VSESKLELLEKLVTQSAARIKKLERDNELLHLQVEGLNTELKKFQNSQSEVRRLTSQREAIKRKLQKMAAKLEAAISAEEKALRTVYGLDGEPIAAAEQIQPDTETPVISETAIIADIPEETVTVVEPKAEPEVTAAEPAQEPDFQTESEEPADEYAAQNTVSEPEPAPSAPHIRPPLDSEPHHALQPQEPPAPVTEPGTEPLAAQIPAQDDEAETAHVPHDEQLPHTAVDFNVDELEDVPESAITVIKPAKRGKIKTAKPEPEPAPSEDDLPLFKDFGA